MAKPHFLVLTVLALATLACHTNNQKSPPPAAASSEQRILHLRELTSRQIKGLDKAKTVVLIPGGILEAHGPYLPIFSDGYWNQKLTDTLAQAIATQLPWQVVVFPVIPLGNSGANDIGGNYAVAGTYSVRFETLRAVFMDLGTELGEQGFRHIVVVHGHGAPMHQRALDQAAAFFEDTYGGQMLNLMGLQTVMSTWFEAPKTAQQQAEDGLSVHAGLAETSSMLYLVPTLVDPRYAQAPPITGTHMETLVRHAQQPSWPGYFGSPRLASRAYGRTAWRQNAAVYTRLVLDILTKKINPDTLAHFGDAMAHDVVNSWLDSLSLREERRRQQQQADWLAKQDLLR
ncbi:creatininase family protein [Hymenobacter roseosalivarius]|nr:creatininase family protein [Hymenobacter roseosalivarius]